MGWKRRAALLKKEEALRASEGLSVTSTEKVDEVPFSLREPVGGEWKDVTFSDIMTMLQPALDRHADEKKGIKFKKSAADKAEEKLEWRSHRKLVNVDALFSPQITQQLKKTG